MKIYSIIKKIFKKKPKQYLQLIENYNSYFYFSNNYKNISDKNICILNDYDYIIIPFTINEILEFNNDRTKYLSLYSYMLDMRKKYNVILLLDNGINIHTFNIFYPRLFCSANFIITNNELEGFMIYDTLENTGFGIKNKLIRYSGPELNLKGDRKWMKIQTIISDQK